MLLNKQSGIDWLKSMDKLSVGAFYLLNTLYRRDVDISDASMMDLTNYGESTHRKQKKELIETGYLSIEQVGKGTYEYTVKDPHGK